MVVCFPSTPKKLAMTIACFLSSAAIIAVGAHLSYVNVEPQRARTLARDDFVRETLKKKHGYIPPMQVWSMSGNDPPQQAQITARNDLFKETMSNFSFKN
ncbi:hypothetical protein Lalb_Chr15g0081811 [Lupinus albus]|uniref:Uncharacterized protein n=1 Tax=Lupinus albus TaxID=3870 RepID=A0A6A4NY72_LUPAL|nr:hypothetical protein Lalb_Chr15g0081811 [Lupinus albus]